MHTPPPRLHLLVARDAPRILIIRRGPSRVFHFVLWDTERDTFERGSWFRGSFYIDRCDLSPDGAFLVYFAMGNGSPLYAWTAIARPPWLKALALWAQNDTWSGGGLWLAKDQLFLGIGGSLDVRPEDTSPAALGIRLARSLPDRGTGKHLAHWRLARDGWRRVKPLERERHDRKQGFLIDHDPGWVIQPTPQHPALRLFYHGYYFGRGPVYTYALDGYPALIGDDVGWAGWDQQGRLIMARAGVVERYTLADLARSEPSLRYDLNAMTAPPAPPRSTAPDPAPSTRAELGPDAAGRYHYLGDGANLVQARTQAGHLVHSQADLQAIAPILREDRTWSFEKPQTYVVRLDGVFVLGGYLNGHVAAASGQPVLAAGEALLQEQQDGTWAIVMLNNRSYGYMPAAESWAALDAALAPTGIPYPREGWSEVYPREGTWADVLAVLRDEDE
jgi:hypothetical protein